ncbi:beta-parvin [Trichinella spiralis]|uniref:beta-parvin n=1 Tax=Trichinella spiralis TaxID=6334 RepID=UPI0001EFD8E0|nr:beta-parvin [Trichinella spiralis]
MHRTSLALLNALAYFCQQNTEQSQPEMVYFLVLLMGLLENYFVPLYGFHLTPTDFDQKVHNVALSFELMQEAGMPQPKSRPEDIVNGDMKCTLRIFPISQQHQCVVLNPDCDYGAVQSCRSSGARQFTICERHEFQQ